MIDFLDILAVSIKLMLSLGIDGPSVNKSIMEKLNQVKREKGFQPLVKCPPSCIIYACHNSFQKGLAKYGYNAEELFLDLYYFFKRSSCRRKDIFEIQDSLGFVEWIVLHDVQNHWLSLLPALQYVVTIKSAVKKLLLNELPKNDKSMVNNDKYLAVKKALDSREVEAKIEFFIR